MKSDVFSKFRTLRSKAYNSYWERRILAEVGYLIELLYDKGGQAKCCLDQAPNLVGFRNAALPFSF